MLFLDDLLLSPITGFKFILRTLARAAEEEYTDDAPIKERLLELQTLLEEGSISEEEYVEQEREILAVLREIRTAECKWLGSRPKMPSGLDGPCWKSRCSFPTSERSSPKGEARSNPGDSMKLGMQEPGTFEDILGTAFGRENHDHHRKDTRRASSSPWRT